MSKLTLAIPFLNKLYETKGIMALLKQNTSDDTEWLIIDNNSDDNVEWFFRTVLKPKKLNFIKNESNIGLVKTYQQIIDLCETEYLSILHSDVFIYEKNWDQRIIRKFEEIDNLGAIGFFGAQGCDSNAGRIQDVEYYGQMAGWSDMLEAEIHGLRAKEEYRPAAVFDGFALSFKMEMLKKAGGIDQNYIYHHIYDREIGLVSLSLGYKNIILNVPCHHVGGLSTGDSRYLPSLRKELSFPDDKNPDAYLHEKNTMYFIQKWKECLPVYVENDFTFRIKTENRFGTVVDYKGNKIVGYILSKK